MGSLVTAAGLEARYKALESAYLRACEAEGYAVAEGADGASVSAQRARIDKLSAEMDKVASEYAALTGGGIEVGQVIPLG